jgi:hypothetical protein
MDLAFAEREIDVLDGRGAEIFLGHLAKFENVTGRH